MKVLLLDIESAPTKVYIWDLFTRYVPHSQIVEPGYTMCWAGRWLGKKQMMFSSVDADGEEGMVRKVWDLLNETDVVIHFNGSKYDIPKLNTEFLKLGLGPPSPFQEIDLYRTVKQRFKLLSNSMAYVAKVLGIKGKHPHKGMDLWTECMEGDQAAWRTMKKYNIQDVAMLEQIYARVLPWIQPHPNVGLYNADGKPVCPQCGGTHTQKRGHYYTNTMRYPRLRCMGCGKWFRSRLNDLSKEVKQNLGVGVK